MLQGPLLLDINFISHFIQREGQRDINRGREKRAKQDDREKERVKETYIEGEKR